MERQKSMETSLLRKSLSIRERKHPNEEGYPETGLLRKSLSIRDRKVPKDDGYLETGFTPKGHPSHTEFKKHQNEDSESSLTVSVCIITFIVVTGSFCVGCGVSIYALLSFFFHSISVS